MTEITESTVIQGVKFVTLSAFADERGRFLETFRKDGSRSAPGRSSSATAATARPACLRGLHYHFHQVDYWYAVQGRIRVGLADLRRILAHLSRQPGGRDR